MNPCAGNYWYPPSLYQCCQLLANHLGQSDRKIKRLKLKPFCTDFRCKLVRVRKKIKKNTEEVVF
jgi:hypothetical protein